MASLPNSNAHAVEEVDTAPLECLRVLIPDTHPNISDYLKEKGLEKAIRTTVRLEEIGSRPDRETIVDLAVVKKELTRAKRCLNCIEEPLDDLSKLFIPSHFFTNHLADPERREWRRWVWVYNKYSSAQIKQSGTALSSVLEWYEMRFGEINRTMAQLY